MAKLSNKEGRELLEAGIIDQETFDKMLEAGKIGAGRQGGARKPKRVFEGTNVSPQLYFKGAKNVEPTEAMEACRKEITSIIEKYTVLAD